MNSLRKIAVLAILAALIAPALFHGIRAAPSLELQQTVTAEHGQVGEHDDAQKAQTGEQGQHGDNDDKTQANQEAKDDNDEETGEHGQANQTVDQDELGEHGTSGDKADTVKDTQTGQAEHVDLPKASNHETTGEQIQLSHQVQVGPDTDVQVVQTGRTIA
jgi:hypothetical protein